ncbi:MAG TPA: IS4 family transposase [Candidatus Binatia bacterium]|nr:IS4 family transposase [Candidatus Binatia bacterium]
MILDPIFAPFLAASPLSVMARALVERAVSPTELNRLFEQHAERQYTRQVTFATLVELMSLVVCGPQPSLCSAYHDQAETIAASLTAVYNKLHGIEDQVCAELVRGTSAQLGPLVEQVGGLCPESIAKYRMRILDGNHLAATEHRLPETRQESAAPLPGQTLAVLEPARMLITEVVPCQDGHAQERSLLDQIVAKIQERDLWLADRNFCVKHFLLAIAARSAFFIIREHANLNPKVMSKLRRRGRIDSGRVSQQRVRIEDEDGEELVLRRVVLYLDVPTRDGETEIKLLTNLPEDEVHPQTVAKVYRERWTIEGAFLELTVTLQCEVKTLCYPKAALFAFCVAVVAYNVQSVLKAALRGVHGAQKINQEVSGYYIAGELERVYEGMMIAVPEEHWYAFAEMPTEEFAAFLRETAGKVRLVKYKKHPRGPKKPAVKRRHRKDHPHVSTAKLLATRKAKKQHCKE